MPGTRLNYNEEIGNQRAKSIIQKKRSESSTNNKDCWLFEGSKNTDGYAQVFMKPNSCLKFVGRKAQKAFLLHIVAQLSKSEQNQTTDNVSHLCNERACFNPDHLVNESPKNNNSRKGCPGTIFCNHCSMISYICPHSPECIRDKK